MRQQKLAVFSEQGVTETYFKSSSFVRIGSGLGNAPRTILQQGKAPYPFQTTFTYNNERKSYSYNITYYCRCGPANATDVSHGFKWIMRDNQCLWTKARLKKIFQ